MKIIINKNKSKIKSFNVTPTEDGFELRMIVQDDDIANKLVDVFKKVQIEFSEEDTKPTVKQPTNSDPYSQIERFTQQSEQKEEPKNKEEIPEIRRQKRTAAAEENSNNQQSFRLEREKVAFVPTTNNKEVESLKKTILVVEDDAMINKAITNKLRKNGYDIVTANDGEEGIEKVLDNIPDLIITDIMMPFTSGLEVIEYVKQKLKLNIPVIVLSALEDEESILKAFKVGADDYISKPFGPDELLIRVKRLLLFSENLNKAIVGKKISQV